MGHVIGIDTTYTGNPVSFNAAQGGTMKSIVVPFTYTQDLHGYANPWPAGGGKNLFQTTATSKTESNVTWTVNDDGSITATGTATGATTILAGAASVDASMGNVAISLDGISAATNIAVNYVRLYDANGNQLAVIISGGLSVTQVVFDLSQYADAAEIRVSLKRNNNVATNGTVHIQVEKGTSFTDWTPYSNICPISGLTGLSVYVSPTNDPDDATVYSGDWSTQAGAAYHGTVDAVAGQLTVDKVSVDLGSINWTYESGYAYPYFIGNMPNDCVVGSDVQGQISVLCSIYESIQNIGASAFRTADHNCQCCLNSNVSTRRLLVQNAAYTDAATFKTAMAGVQLVYDLETPITYWITPKQIAALIGQNYIWSSNNETLNTVLTAPAIGFAGWLIKCVTNGTPVEIPLKYMRAETYTVTPDQRMEWSAERDVTGVLHRETVQNLPPKIEFNTPLMTNSDINALNSIIKAAFTSYLQRNITIQFYDPERNQYWEWDCYMPDVKYHIRNADTVNNIVNYEELRYAFIGY